MAQLVTKYITDAAVTNAKLANLAQGSVKVGGGSNAVTDLDASTDKQILIGDGTDVKSVAISGDIAISNTGVTAIQADTVANTMLENIAQGSIKVGGAANAPTDLDAKTDGQILVGDGTDIASVAVSGDVTLANTGAVTIAAEAVTLAKMANMATASFIARDTAGAGVPEVINVADALTMLSVESGADVTDETNVTDALDGATLAAATVAVDDKVLIQDTDGSDALKTVTVSSIVALASGSTRIVEIVTLDATDISNKYNDDLTQVPKVATSVNIVPVGGIPQEYTVDFTIITDTSDIKRINWDGLGLEALVESTDKLMVTYTY